MWYVLGHQNPDTDSFCAAMVYAKFLNDTGTPAQAIVLGEANAETAYVFEQLGLSFPEIKNSLPAGSDIVLVDHNEVGQSISDRDNLRIRQVIDHHKVADFHTADPLMMRVEPVGCTCTILHEMFVEKGYTPDQNMATLMIAAICSDTLYFRSPTTTEHDRSAIEALCKIANIDDVEQYSLNMFNAKSDLGDISAVDLVQSDYKVFELGSKKVGVGVLETTNPAYVFGREEEVIPAMQSIKDSQGLYAIFFCAIDILNEKNTMFVLDGLEKDIVQGSFGVTDFDGVYADLGNRVSRKKTIVPDLDRYLTD